MAAGYQGVGIGFQVLTLGIPNPVSGGCMAIGSEIGAQQKGAAARGETFDIAHLNRACEEAIVKGAGGAASCGGVIPYAGTMVVLFLLFLLTKWFNENNKNKNKLCSTKFVFVKQKKTKITNFVEQKNNKVCLTKFVFC